MLRLAASMRSPDLASELLEHAWRLIELVLVVRLQT